MEKLNFPTYSYTITDDENGRRYILDPIRKKRLLLTPEEWVRQHVLSFLQQEKKFPANLISTEAGLKVNRLSCRYDALVYNRQGAPVLLIECKAPSVKIDQKVFDQIAAYNQTVQAPYLFITNGLKHFCCYHDQLEKKYRFLDDIPEFEAL
ncbi:MAG: type I restriction enzyme HsdR N-terminal domain-containing protein [Bacteroidales bacterium]|nr:type I restriction enzyme HsdR N-terminal domain-containing protein [Bacteroidales bacterium]